MAHYSCILIIAPASEIASCSATVALQYDDLEDIYSIRVSQDVKLWDYPRLRIIYIYYNEYIRKAIYHWLSRSPVAISQRA